MNDKGIIFASEIKAILQNREVKKIIIWKIL